MKIILNGKVVHLTHPPTIQHLFDNLKWDVQHGLAVSVNQEIIPVSQWAMWSLQENDVIDVIQAVQGG